jgi:shikimate kinase
MNNITLIGMPGAGKSSIGVVLAKVLGYQFIDSDLLIQKEEKRTLSEIIEQDGIDGFKAVENRVNASIQVENTVIATGGSVVYCDEAMQHLKSEGVVVYLKISLKLLSKRLGNLKDRGVVLVAVVTKRCRSLFDSQYGILSGARDVFGFGICGETVPFRSASVGFCETHLIHP